MLTGRPIVRLSPRGVTRPILSAVLNSVLAGSREAVAIAVSCGSIEVCRNSAIVS